MTSTTFFDECTEQSYVKSAIVSKYFHAWAKVMIGAQRKLVSVDPRIAYIDLFAGPGRYNDGTISTPLQVLKIAAHDDELRQRLVTIFNDRDANNTDSLNAAIAQLPEINRLKYSPKVMTEEVGDRIVKMFEEMKLVPTLFFVDPWGYKGLSLRLVNSVIKDWGCDCIFFFNYNRINMGINNKAVCLHMDALFGPDRARVLRAELEKIDSRHRELTIVEKLCQSLRDLGPPFVLPFRFRDSRGTRTSHHLIFVSKGFKGYEIMKEIMAKESSNSDDGVASFEYCPASPEMEAQQQLLFRLSRPLDELAEMLLQEYAGRSLTLDAIYRDHSVDRPYIKKNYKQTILMLEEQGRLSVDKHRKNTLADRIRVTFPDISVGENG